MKNSALIRKYLLEAEIREIAIIESFPHEEFDYSERFKKRLEEIKAYARAKEEVSRNKSSGRMLIFAAIIAIMVMLCTACTLIKPVRDFVIEIYEKCTNIFLTSENIGELNQKFELSYIPERYELNESSIFDDAGMYEKRYDYGEKSISLMMVNGSSISSYDSEGVPMKDVYINGIQIYLFTKWSNDIAVWTDGEYLFTLSYPEDLDFSEVEKMIMSLSPIDDEQ